MKDLSKEKGTVKMNKEIISFGNATLSVSSEIEFLTVFSEKKAGYHEMMRDPNYEENTKREVMISLFNEIEPFIKIFKNENWQKREATYRAVILIGNHII